MMTRLLALALAGVFLAACAAGNGTEMPSNSGSGSDKMRSSPCACAPVEFDGQVFRWG